MAEHEALVARLNLIAQDAAELDSRARKAVLDATLSCSAKLLAQPSTDQSDALKDLQVQRIDPLPLQTDDMDTSAVTVPAVWDSLPGDHEIPTGDPWAADFSQQSTENLPSSFVNPCGPKSLNYSPMSICFDQQYIQNSCCRSIEMGTPSDWSTSFPNHSPSTAGTVALGSLNGGYQIPDLTDEIYSPPAPHATFGLWNNLSPIALFGSSANTATITNSMTIDLFNSTRDSSYLDDLAPIPRHLVPSAQDQLDSGIDHSNTSFTRPVADLDVDRCVFQEPVGTSTFLWGEESPTPRTFQRLAFQGKITTADSYLATNTYNTVPAFMGSSEGFDCELPWDQQQRLCGELKATRVGLLPGRSESGKVVKTIRRKKTPSPEERRQIAETRRMGACYLCNRDRRKCCGTKGSCNHCAKTVGSLLASHICLTGLQIHRSKLNTIQYPYDDISLRCQPLVTPLQVFQRCTRSQGQRCNSIWFKWFKHFKLHSLDEAESLYTRPQQHAVSCALDKLEDSIDALFSVYCDMSPCLPMRDCVMTVLKVVCCDKIDCRCLRGPRYRYQTKSRVEWRDIPAVESNSEKELLGMLDEHMNYESNRQFPNAMMFGLCIRRLSLFYRRELMYSTYFRIMEHVSKRLPKNPPWVLEVQENIRSMYDGCISAYSKVYHKGKSPYSLNWRLQDHMEELGNDAALAEMFGQIKTQERRVCEAFEHDENDKVLRELFLKPKQRGEKSWGG